MAQLHKLQGETDIKSPAGKFYGEFKNSISKLTKAFPEMYKSIQVLEGDGKTVGSLLLLKYETGNDAVLVAKDRIVAVDDNERSITYEVVEGDLHDMYKKIVLNMQVTEKVNTNAVNWTLEYEKTSADVADPDMILGLLVKATKKFDAYILKET